MDNKISNGIVKFRCQRVSRHVRFPTPFDDDGMVGKTGEADDSLR